MLLGETEPAQAENLSHSLRVVSSLFDVLSGQSEVDHPLCEVRGISYYTEDAGLPFFDRAAGIAKRTLVVRFSIEVYSMGQNFVFAAVW